MQEEQKAEVTRRSLIRRAGTVAAGVGAAGIASAAIASPAQATDGQPVVQGQVNQGGNSTTTIVNNSGDKAALTLNNPGGPPLNLAVSSSPTFSAPVGSIFADDHGSLYTVGDKAIDENGSEVTVPKFIGRTSPAFSTSVSFITPERWLVTLRNFTMPNGANGHQFIVPGSANIDSAGRVIPKNNNNMPDLSLDFSDWFYQYGIFGVQGTLLVMSATNDGFVAMYDTPVWPGTSSMNFQRNLLRDGFTQMGFTTQSTVNFKVSQPVVLIFDIFAFIVGNGTGKFNQGGAAAERSAGAAITGRPDKLPKEFTPRKAK